MARNVDVNRMFGPCLALDRNSFNLVIITRKLRDIKPLDISDVKCKCYALVHGRYAIEHACHEHCFEDGSMSAEIEFCLKYNSRPAAGSE